MPLFEREESNMGTGCDLENATRHARKRQVEPSDEQVFQKLLLVARCTQQFSYPPFILTIKPLIHRLITVALFYMFFKSPKSGEVLFLLRFFLIFFLSFFINQYSLLPTWICPKCFPATTSPITLNFEHFLNSDMKLCT